MLSFNCKKQNRDTPNYGGTGWCLCVNTVCQRGTEQQGTSEKGPDRCSDTQRLHSLLIGESPSGPQCLTQSQLQINTQAAHTSRLQGLWSYSHAMLNKFIKKCCCHVGLFHQTMRRLLFKICQWWKLFLVVKKPAQCILNANIYKNVHLSCVA